MTATRDRRTRRPLTPLVVLLVGIAIVVVLVGVASRVANFGLRNPFAETTHENPNAVVLAELREQSRYVAASGRFQTVIDTEQDADYLPDVLKGSREIFIAEGDVDGWTEFGGLSEDAVQVSPDGKSLTVHIPPAQLSPPRLDTGATRLVSRERGILDRVGDALGGGDPGNQQALYQRAEQKITEAAQRSELTQRTEENTEKFLRSLFEGMGYTDVKVVFDGTKAANR
jgi:Protein of unknown function (DUF4230)